jgi:hypothetical protein
VLFGALLPVAGQPVDATRGVDTVVVKDGRGETDPVLSGLASNAGIHRPG